MELPVFVTGGTNVSGVTLLKGSKDDALLTRNWPKIVKEAGINEGDICVFTFVIAKRPGFQGNVVALN